MESGASSPLLLGLVLLSLFSVVFHLPIRSAVSRSNREAAHVPGRCDRVVRQAWTLL
uniref:Uncharacterized protein n=1 Tax=Aegilops tauschii TaxID=37682 RepID=M8AXD4_AEGTA